MNHLNPIHIKIQEGADPSHLQKISTHEIAPFSHVSDSQALEKTLSLEAPFHSAFQDLLASYRTREWDIYPEIVNT